MWDLPLRVGEQPLEPRTGLVLLRTVGMGVFNLSTDFFGKNGLTDLACSEDIDSIADPRAVDPRVST